MAIATTTNKVVAKITPVTTDVEGVWRLITRKAYELYEQRDKQDGWDLADWLEAEEIVMDELHQARE
jgi:hypothetical protein